jgi:hypothetical protein
MSKGITLTAAQLKKALRDGRIIKPRVMHVPAGLVAAALEYEADIETTIVDAMVRDGWRAFKMEYSFDKIKKLTLGEPGMCDHLFLRPARGLKLHASIHDREGNGFTTTQQLGFAAGEVLWWEFKASKRRRKRAELLSPDQVLWTEAEKRKGFLVWIAGIDHDATLAGAARHYLESGLCRRREVFQPLAGPERRSTP